MRILKVVWKKWLIVSGIIGNFQAQVILSIFYLFVLCVLGIIFRFFTDPLNIKSKTSRQKQSHFLPWEYPEDTLAQARKQF